jgi:hypothetical protein
MLRVQHGLQRSRQAITDTLARVVFRLKSGLPGTYQM